MSPQNATAARLVSSSRGLADAVERLRFHAPVRFVYHPLRYARESAEAYLRRYAFGPREVVFLGMNPGPWGMAQTGVPFGEIAAVRDWLGITGRVERPLREHPRLEVRGFDCTRSEVSGRRLWGLMRARFASAEEFFRRHFVANYCPLLLLDAGGRNVTPDRLSAVDRARLFPICDGFLAEVLRALRPAWAIGVGTFAERRIAAVVSSTGLSGIRVARIPHPSPASPLANKGWEAQVEAVLVDLGVWERGLLT